ncbi:hypothetical protein RKD48_003670 [Streptomyces ambofaciens]
MRWTKSSDPSSGRRSSPLRRTSARRTVAASPWPAAEATDGSARSTMPSAVSTAISVRPLSTSAYASRWSSSSWASSLSSTASMPRSRSRRASSIVRAASYNSLRPVGR